MQVTVILVNYGQWEHTRKSLESLERSEGVEISITLVDNCSPGEVPSWVYSASGLRFRRLEKNTGFAEGNNRGFKLSAEDNSEYTLFLNNDAEVAQETIGNLVRFLDDNPEAGIVTPPVYHASAPERIWSAGGRFIPWKMRFDQKVYKKKDDLPDRAVRVDFASGCAMMIRTGLFKKIGGFREDFFMYYEDADLCRKVIDEGYSIWLLPSEKVIHHVAAGSGGELSKLAVYFSERNRFILSRDMLGTPVRVIFFLYFSVVLIVISFKFLLWQGPELIPWIWRGYLNGITGKTGHKKELRKLCR